MSLAADKKRWDKLHNDYAKAREAESEYDRYLHGKYGRYEASWLTRTERAKIDALSERSDKIGDKIVDLLVEISPRGDRWLSGVPSWWLREKLTWEDAIRPKEEPLSVVVPGSYGYPDGTVKESTVKRRRTPNAETAGIQYATDQVESEYFMDWVREQIAEASRLPPEDVLPLETKSDARRIVRNMLQQLEWDAQRDLKAADIERILGISRATPDVIDEFWSGFKRNLESPSMLEWLADELLEIKGEIQGPRVANIAPEIIAARRHEFIEQLRHKSPDQPDSWYERQADRQPMFQNPEKYPWWFREETGGGRVAEEASRDVPVIPGSGHGLEWHRYRDSLVGTVNGERRFLLDPTADGDWILWGVNPKTGVQTRKIGRFPTSSDAQDAARLSVSAAPAPRAKPRTLGAARGTRRSGRPRSPRS